MKKPKSVYIYQASIYAAASVFFLFAAIFTKNSQRTTLAVILAVLFAGLVAINLLGNRKAKAKAAAKPAAENEKTEQ